MQEQSEGNGADVASTSTPATLTSRSSKSSHGVFVPPTFDQQQLHAEADATAEDIQKLTRQRLRPWPLRILKSSQIDASRLDDELTAMLYEQFLRIFKPLQQAHTAGMESELKTLLKLLIFLLSVGRGFATPGSELLNLYYRNERAIASSKAHGGLDTSAGRTGIEGEGLTGKQITLLGTASVFVPYLWLKLGKLATVRNWGAARDDFMGEWFWRIFQGLETGVRLLDLLNFGVFLVDGEYRTFHERLVGARLVYKQATMARSVNFEYMNRQLVWHETSELLLFLLPLLNVNQVRHWMTSLLPMLRREQKSEEKSSGLNPGAQRPEPASNTTCPICGATEIVTPFIALPCRHKFCYYCIRAHCEDDRHFKCPLDHGRITGIQRHVQ